MAETKRGFLIRIADFLESHGRDEGGYSAAMREEFSDDAHRLRKMAGPAPAPRSALPFTKGQRVVVELPGSPARTGTVSANSRRADRVTLRFDGRTTQMTYHVSFVRPASVEVPSV